MDPLPSYTLATIPVDLTMRVEDKHSGFTDGSPHWEAMILTGSLNGHRVNSGSGMSNKAYKWWGHGFPPDFPKGALLRLHLVTHLVSRIGVANTAWASAEGPACSLFLPSLISRRSARRRSAVSGVDGVVMGR